MVLVKQLLEDARILWAYASRKGRAVPESAATGILAAARHVRSRANDTEDEAVLNCAISELLKTIAPDDLSSARSAFAASSPTLTGRLVSRLRLVRPPKLPTLLNAFTVLLALVVINVTTSYNRLNLIIGDISETNQNQFISDIDGIREAATKDGKFDAQLLDDPNGPRYDIIVKLRSALQRADGHFVASMSAMGAIFDATAGRPNWCNIFWNYYGLGAVCLNGQAEAPLAEASNGQTPDSPLRPPTRVGMAMVAEPLGLSITDPQGFSYLYTTLRGAEAFAAFLGGSILPMLYGVLGAAVFLIRRFYFDPDYLDQLRSPVGSTFLRLGLGGISGLTISWFAAPDLAAGTIAKVTSAPLALAFLAGFSIDLLFSILDRVLAAVSPPPETHK